MYNKKHRTLDRPEQLTLDPDMPGINGKTIVFTGRLNRWTRAEAFQVCKLLNAECSNSVSNSSDILVVGKLPSKNHPDGKTIKFRSNYFYSHDVMFVIGFFTIHV